MRRIIIVLIALSTIAGCGGGGGNNSYANKIIYDRYQETKIENMNGEDKLDTPPAPPAYYDTH